MSTAAALLFESIHKAVMNSAPAAEIVSSHQVHRGGPEDAMPHRPRSLNRIGVLCRSESREVGEVEYLPGWLFLRHRTSWLRACRVRHHSAGSPSEIQEYIKGKSRTRNDLSSWWLKRPAPAGGAHQVVPRVALRTIPDRSSLSFPCSSSDTTPTDVIFPPKWAHRFGKEGGGKAHGRRRKQVSGVCCRAR